MLVFSSGEQFGGTGRAPCRRGLIATPSGARRLCKRGARVYARATRPGPAEGDAPRAGLERREDLVLASKRGPEVRAARGREKGRVPRTVIAVLVPLPVSAAEPAYHDASFFAQR